MHGMGSFSVIIKSLSYMSYIGQCTNVTMVSYGFTRSLLWRKKSLKTSARIIKSPKFWLIYTNFSTGFRKPLHQATQKWMTLGFFSG